MNKERLELMATMLQEVADGVWKGVPAEHRISVEFLGLKFNLFRQDIKNFDMEMWCVRGDTPSCGFSACAVGHAMHDPRFIAQGLKCDEDSFLPVFGKHDYWAAVREFFEIESETAFLLFLPTQYPGNIEFGIKPEQVKSRIMELLTLGEEELLKKYPESEEVTG